MSKQSMTMPSIDQNTFTRLTCAVFCPTNLPPDGKWTSKTKRIINVLQARTEWRRNNVLRMCIYIMLTSALTAFVLAVLRILKPEVFYVNELIGKDLVLHLVVSGMMVLTSSIGFINSCVVMARSSADNTVKFLTAWLLLDSLFETSRVIYVFVCEVVLSGGALMQTYDLCISCGQYFLDSFLYCQMILRH